jgi:hypothetical protein
MAARRLGCWTIFNFFGVYVFDRQMGWEQSAVEKEAEKIRQTTKK